MQSISEIRRHMYAVENTKQITNAMYLLSTSRMKKAMAKVEYNRTYFRRVRATVKDILSKSQGVNHPYLNRRTVKCRAYIVVGGDKGMAGAYNDNLLKFAYEKIRGDECRYVFAVGIMAVEFFRKKGIKVDQQVFGVAQNPSLHKTRHIVEDFFSLYDRKLVDEVYIIYTEFKNSVLQVPSMVRLLPVSMEDYQDVDVEYRYETDMIYEPSAQDVFNIRVPQYTVGLVYGAFMQSFAREHSARLIALESATKNADEMLKKLQTQYNAARQVAITQEISEIVGAASALGDGE